VDGSTFPIFGGRKRLSGGGRGEEADWEGEGNEGGSS
jgi:hypothetical protein